MAVRPARLRQLGNGLVIPVRLTPNAAHNAIDGWREVGDGARRLAVKVTAVPEKGKANAALEKLLAKQLGVGRTAVSVQSGATSRQKEVLVTGDPESILAALERATGGPHG